MSAGQGASRWRWLRGQKKKMPAANLSGCHCGCRWWGRDSPSLRGLRNLTCLSPTQSGGGLGHDAVRCTHLPLFGPWTQV